MTSLSRSSTKIMSAHHNLTHHHIHVTVSLIRMVRFSTVHIKTHPYKTNILIPLSGVSLQCVINDTKVLIIKLTHLYGLKHAKISEIPPNYNYPARSCLFYNKIKSLLKFNLHSARSRSVHSKIFSPHKDLKKLHRF